MLTFNCECLHTKILRRNACLSDAWNLKKIPANLGCLICYAYNNFLIVTPAEPTTTTNVLIRYRNRAAEKLLTKSQFEAGAKRMESENVRPPKCKIGRSKHKPIWENPEIQRKYIHTVE